MKNIIYLSLLLLCFTSCLPKHEVARTPQSARTRATKQATKSTTTRAKSSNTPRTSQSGLEYINQYKHIAIREMETFGIPASIKLAQAILESGSGNSPLARESNNHFGIKCSTGWQGNRTYHHDDNPDDCFRVYTKVEDSFRDHSEFLLRNRYAKLFELEKDDYKGWAKGLKAAGYATNPRYAELLIDLIERYDLQQYDRPESRQQRVERTAVVQVEIKEQPVETKSEIAAKPPVNMVIHEVRTGETLSSISRTYGVSVEELKVANGLKEEALSIGQLLVVSK